MLEAIKAWFLKSGISILVSLLPTLAGLIGGPWGWIASIAVKYLSGLLITWAERYRRFAKIEQDIALQVSAVISATKQLNKAEDSTRAAELEKFTRAVRDLTRFNVVQ